MKLKHLPLILIFLCVNLASAQTPEPAPALKALHWHPDSRRIAVGYADGRVEVIAAATSEILFTFSDADGSADNVLWSHDGGKFAAGIGGHLYVWDATTYVQLHFWDAFETPITSLAWSPDGTELASTNRVSSEVVELKFWNLALDGLRFISGIGAQQIAWDTTQNRLTGIDELATVIIDPLTGHLQNLCSHCSSDSPYEIAWSPNGARIALATHYYIALPDLQGTKAFGIDTDGHAVYSVSWSPSSIYLASGDDAGKVQIWNPDTFALTQEIVTGQEAIYAVDWSPDGTRLAYGGTDGRLEIRAVALDLLIPTPIVLDVAWSPNGDMIATVDDSGTLNVTLSDQITPVFEFARPVTLIEAAVDWSPQGDYLATGIGNSVLIWDSEHWQLIHQFVAGDPDGVINYYTPEVPEGIANIRWSLDGHYVVVGSLSYITTVWNQAESRILYQALDASSGGPGRVWLSGDGWMSDGTSKRNAFTGEYFRPSRDENPNVFVASAEGATTEPRPDNTQVAWGTVHGRLVIIDLATLSMQETILVNYNDDPFGQRLGIADLSWNGTWDFIAAVSRDGELYVINLATEEVTSILKVDGKLNAVDWNPQSTEIIYAGVSDSGQPILSIVDVSGIGGVPATTPNPMPAVTPTP